MSGNEFLKEFSPLPGHESSGASRVPQIGVFTNVRDRVSAKFTVSYENWRVRLDVGSSSRSHCGARKGVATSNRSAEMLAQLAGAYGRAGLTSRARALLSELETRGRTQHVSPLAFAIVHTSLGQAERAIDALEAADRRRDWWVFAAAAPR